MAKQPSSQATLPAVSNGNGNGSKGVPAPLTQSKFLALRDDSEFAEAYKANMSGESITEADLQRVKTPSGGATKWTVEDIDGERTVDAIEGALVYYGQGGLLWPSLNPKGGTLPVLRSNDGKTAYRINEDIGDIDPKVLAACELKDENGKSFEPKRYDITPVSAGGKFTYADFGTGKEGRGKRWQEYRVLCILPEDGLMPYLIYAKPGSLKNMKKFILGLTAKNVPFYRAVVSLRLKKESNSAGQEYSQIVPQFLGKLSKEEGDVILRNFTRHLEQAVHTADVELDGSGE